ncbi:MAG TPA: hypothetical protein VEJ63_02635 [Planctomycetota bacterium]|nr:hypothetical protein [Planctomycetota bacterium]
MLTRIADMAGRVVVISGIVFCIAFATAILDITLGMFLLMRYSIAVIIGCLVLGGVAAIVRFGISTFGSAQVRLSELLATFLAGAAVASIAAMQVKSTESDAAEQTKMVIQYTAASLGFFFTGSGWAWMAAQRLDERNPAERLKLMLTGWIVCVGGLAATLFISTLLAVIFANPVPSSLYWVLGLSPPVCLLLIPGFRLERRCRDAQKRAAAMKLNATQSENALDTTQVS